MGPASCILCLYPRSAELLRGVSRSSLVALSCYEAYSAHHSLRWAPRAVFCAFTPVALSSYGAYSAPPRSVELLRGVFCSPLAAMGPASCILCLYPRSAELLRGVSCSPLAAMGPASCILCLYPRSAELLRGVSCSSLVALSCCEAYPAHHSLRWAPRSVSCAFTPVALSSYGAYPAPPS